MGRALRQNLLSVVLCTVIATPVFAQLQTPAPSPLAKVEQQVGISTFQVDYSSPGVKGRTIWGAVVPFDKQWRTGANAAC